MAITKLTPEIAQMITASIRAGIYAIGGHLVAIHRGDES